MSYHRIERDDWLGHSVHPLTNRWTEFRLWLSAEKQRRECQKKQKAIVPFEMMNFCYMWHKTAQIIYFHENKSWILKKHVKNNNTQWSKLQRIAQWPFRPRFAKVVSDFGCFQFFMSNLKSLGLYTVLLDQGRYQPQQVHWYFDPCFWQDLSTKRSMSYRHRTSPATPSALALGPSKHLGTVKQEFWWVSPGQHTSLHLSRPKPPHLCKLCALLSHCLILVYFGPVDLEHCGSGIYFPVCFCSSLLPVHLKGPLSQEALYPGSSISLSLGSHRRGSIWS